MLRKKPVAHHTNHPEGRRRSRTRDVFVDAAPRRVVVEEEYFLDEEVSEHHRTEWGQKPPRGSVEWHVPYDGPVLRRVARSRRQARRLFARDEPVVVGRLTVTDHDDTDLAEAAKLDARHDSVLLTLPTSFTETPAAELAAGRHEAVGRIEYSPTAGRPELLPVTCIIEINDPESAGVRPLSDFEVLDQTVLSAESTRLMGQAEFRGGLEIAVDVVVCVDVPRKRSVEAPIVRKVSVELPHLTSAHSDSLWVGLDDGTDQPFHHRVSSRTVEWRDIPTTAEEEHADERGNDVRRHVFRSKTASLALGQPGELFDRSELVIHVEVEMPGHLLSGTQVRLFDAAGRLAPEHGGPTCRTVLHSTCTVVLDDAFARRRFSPFQSIVFDEIVPEEARAVDVSSVLTSLGFRVDNYELTDPDLPPDTRMWLLHARRNEGPTESELAVVVRGRRAATHRKSQQGTEHQYSSRVDSGELALFIRGWTQGDVAVLVSRINELHRALRDRFRPLRSRR